MTRPARPLSRRIPPNPVTPRIGRAKVQSERSRLDDLLDDVRSADVVVAVRMALEELSIQLDVERARRARIEARIVALEARTSAQHGDAKT